MFKKIVGCSLIGMGVCAAVYAGGWLCFVGGIVDIVSVIKAPSTDATLLAFGIIKFLVTGLVTLITSYPLVYIGSLLLQGENK